MITNFIESIDESPTVRADASKVSIEDFNLIKVLGKGSFGKVIEFLFENINFLLMFKFNLKN